MFESGREIRRYLPCKCNYLRQTCERHTSALPWAHRKTRNEVSTPVSFKADFGYAAVGKVFWKDNLHVITFNFGHQTFKFSDFQVESHFHKLSILDLLLKAGLCILPVLAKACKQAKWLKYNQSSKSRASKCEQRRIFSYRQLLTTADSMQ